MANDIHSIPGSEPVFRSPVQIDNIPLRDERHPHIGLKLDNHSRDITGSGGRSLLTCGRERKFHHRVTRGDRSIRSHSLGRGQNIVHLDDSNDGKSIHQLTHVLTGCRMEHFACSLVDREEIAHRHFAGILQLEIKHIVLPQLHAIPDSLVIAGDHIHHAILRSRLLNGSGGIGTCRFTKADAVEIVGPGGR